MAYKAFKGKWQAFGDKPVISILSTGLICFNKACYDTYVKSSGYKYVKLYYEPEMKKIAFEFRSDKKGDYVFSVNLAKTGLLAIINGKIFFKQFGIKPLEQSRSFPVHQTKPSSRIKGIEIKLTEYFPANS